MKKFIFGRCLLYALFIVSLFSFAGTNRFLHGAELIYDGNFVRKTDMARFGGIEYIPLKAAAVLFNGKTQWYPIAGKVVFQLQNQKITFTIDNRYAAIGKSKFPMDGPARAVKGTIYVPVEFFLTKAFTEIADCGVQWHSSSQILAAEPHVSLFAPRIYSRSGLTRIVVESAEDISPEVDRKGDCITVNIPKVRIAGEESIKVNDAVVKNVKVLRARKGAVLKVDLAGHVTSYAWCQKSDPNRIILEVFNPNPSQSAWNGTPEKEILTEAPKAIVPEIAAGAAAASQEKAENVAPAPEQKKIFSGARVKKIVVDAGHGGEDPGAIGRSGTKEKDINLLIALELARVLRIEGGYDVILTRSDDTFVPLIDRSLFANDQRADLFISIHCNASLKKTEGGFEIYFLAEDATDIHAEATAEFENAVVGLEAPQSSKKQELQTVLFSMVRNEFINESSLLCSTIEKAVVKRAHINSRGVKQADFHVLHGAAMPSVLVETAFITRVPEEQKLRQRKFRSSVVDAVLTGVQNYEHQLKMLNKR